VSDAVRTVSTELTARLRTFDQPAPPVSARFTYSADDPFAVTVTFVVDGTLDVTWCMSRELMREGLWRECGEGDVSLRPVTVGARREVELFLSSAEGAALIELPGPPLADFLDQTYRMVPEGAETEHFDVDLAIQQLLAS
jgi:hypothetical protein